MKKTSDKLHNNKIITDIANYIFENPDKKVSDVLSVFVGKCRKSSRTIERYIRIAKEYNVSRLKEKEKAVNDIMVSSAKESAKAGLKTREYFIAKLEGDFESLDAIVSGAVYKDVDSKTGEIVGFRQADFKDEISAKARRQGIVGQLAELQGWSAPTKQELTGKDGSPIVPAVASHEHVVIFKDFRGK